MLIAAGAIAALAVAGGVGYVIGRPDPGEVSSAAGPPPSASSSPQPTATASVTPGVALTSQDAVLRLAEAQVSPEPADAPCTALATAGVPADCGEVQVSGRRVVWVVERLPVGEGATAHTVRVLTFAEDAGGWISELAATDPQARRWTGVRVAPMDLTGDGVPELLVGYRLLDRRESLEVDVVGYTRDGLPEVIGHPERAPRGSLIPATGGFDLFGGRYPGGEDPCCPPVFERQDIRFSGGALLMVAVEEIAPAQVPESLL